MGPGGMSDSNNANPEATAYGYTRVSPEEKSRRVRAVFDRVAARYDVMNDLMSGGLHRLWKDSFVRQIGPKAGDVIVDLAGGTGDIAFRMHRAARGEAQITVCDINTAMMRVGRRRGYDRGLARQIRWVTGSAEALPFKDDSVDVLTIAFGLRNVTHIDQALAEAVRVLRPGGRFYCLEFSKVQDPLLARVYDAYSFAVIPTLGALVTQDRESYRYLAESIRMFPDRASLADRMRGAGFAQARHRAMTFGAVAVHEGLVI